MARQKALPISPTKKRDETALFSSRSAIARRNRSPAQPTIDPHSKGPTISRMLRMASRRTSGLPPPSRLLDLVPFAAPGQIWLGIPEKRALSRRRVPRAPGRLPNRPETRRRSIRNAPRHWTPPPPRHPFLPVRLMNCANSMKTTRWIRPSRSRPPTTSNTPRSEGTRWRADCTSLLERTLARPPVRRQCP